MRVDHNPLAFSHLDLEDPCKLTLFSPFVATVKFLISNVPNQPFVLASFVLKKPWCLCKCETDETPHTCERVTIRDSLRKSLFEPNHELLK